MGRIGRPFGVKGWLHVQSFTSPAQALGGYRDWRLTGSGEPRAVAVVEAKPHGDGIVVLLGGVLNREQAALLTGSMVQVARAALPPTAPKEFYRVDLLGFRVRNLQGRELGVVDHFVDAPANDVMVVRGEREHWIPASALHLRRIDAAERLIEVDWPEELE
jgi:16S rRNA processing protein RimM